MATEPCSTSAPPDMVPTGCVLLNQLEALVRRALVVAVNWVLTALSCFCNSPFM